MKQINKIISSIKNGKNAGLQTIKISGCFSKSNLEFLKVLWKEGYINGFKYNKNLEIYLKYNKTGKNAISTIIQISKSGKRIYTSSKPLWKVKSGFGIFILSTPKGIMSDSTARSLNLGGEVICGIA